MIWGRIYAAAIFNNLVVSPPACHAFLVLLIGQLRVTDLSRVLLEPWKCTAALEESVQSTKNASTLKPLPASVVSEELLTANW
jgi:hypothetical protein